MYNIHFSVCKFLFFPKIAVPIRFLDSLNKKELSIYIVCLSDSGLQCNKTNSDWYIIIICVEENYLALLLWNNKMYGIEGKEVIVRSKFINLYQ